MRTRTFNTKNIVQYLEKKKIATLDELKKALGTTARMTVFRLLKEVDAITSYSHRGQYYSLAQNCEFDKTGLWSYQDVKFSVHGNLIKTARVFVDTSSAGLTASELGQQLQAETKRATEKLLHEKQILRSRIEGVYVYTSIDKIKRKSQLLVRREQAEIANLGLLPEGVLNSQELKAAIILFFSLLDEQQRRFYAGLESYKLGYGGDKTMATFLGLDQHTVSRGRNELFDGQYTLQQTRRKGGGRQSIEKKHPE
jgi:hypothetical protein